MCIGTNTIARVDFENSTYVCREHTPYLLDVDRLHANVVATARDSNAASQWHLSFVLSQMGLSTGPFPHEHRADQ